MKAKAPEAVNERVLRAKYLDWCSARIAERFLELTPDEIYELAQRASPDAATASGGASNSSGDSAAGSEIAPGIEIEPIESFRRIVVRVTEVLAATIAMPDFEEWQKAYSQSPDRYEEEMLGFWKETR